MSQELKILSTTLLSALWTNSSLTIAWKKIIIIPVWKKSLKHRDVKDLAQVHTASVSTEIQIQSGPVSPISYYSESKSQVTS